jgi:hypothetical protein
MHKFEKTYFKIILLQAIASCIRIIRVITFGVNLIFRVGLDKVIRHFRKPVVS